MIKKKINLVIVSTLIMMLLVACGSGNTSSNESGNDNNGEVLNLKITHVASSAHPYTLAAQIFGDELAKVSGNTMKLEIYADAKLGPEKDVIEGILNGTIDMALLSGDGGIGNVVPEMNLFGIPFVFRDREHVYKVLDGEIGQELLDKVSEKGMVGLSFWENGFRHMTSDDQAIVNPEDMKGLKMRVQPSPVWQSFMESLGAIPTTVEFNELYSALEQGVVDGQENPIVTIQTSKFYETQKHLSLTGHVYSPCLVVMSQKTYDSLTDQQKEWLMQVIDIPKEQRTVNLENEMKILEELKNEGVTVSEPNKEAFIEATLHVSEVLADKVPAELVERVRNAAN